MSPVNPKRLAPIAAAAVLSLTAAGLATAAPAQNKPAAAAVKTVTVNDLAANPSAHLGRVAVLGVVGVVDEKGKSFLLIDPREYKACGLSCLSEAGTKKVPVRWSGAAPKVESAVRVEGVLAKTDKGLTFTASKVSKAEKADKA